MTPLAHISVSYLLSQTPRLFGVSLTPPETAAIVIAGNILDLDLIVSVIKRKMEDHHTYFTHTPLFAFFVWLVYLALFGRTFSFVTHILFLVSIMLHLVMDECSYWFYRMGWQTVSRYQQINWLFPFVITNRAPREKNPETIHGVINDYFAKTWVNNWLEVIFVAASLILLLTTNAPFGSARAAVHANLFHLRW